MLYGLYDRILNYQVMTIHTLGKYYYSCLAMMTEACTLLNTDVEVTSRGIFIERVILPSLVKNVSTKVQSMGDTSFWLLF